MSLTLDQHAAEIRERGYTIVENVLNADELDEAREVLQSIFEREAPIAEDRGWLSEMWRVTYLLPQKHELFRRFPLNPRVLPLMRKVLGDNCVLASLNGLTMRPGGQTQNLHIDAHESTPGTTLFINALHCLDDFTRANGCTRVIPGSQRWIWRRPEPNWRMYEPETVHLEAPAGSLIAYDGALVHAGSKNNTDQPRRAIHAFYSKPWVKPQWDYRRSLSEDVVATLTPEQRKLLALDRFVPYYDVMEERTIFREPRRLSE